MCEFCGCVCILIYDTFDKKLSNFHGMDDPFEFEVKLKTMIEKRKHKKIKE